MTSSAHREQAAADAVAALIEPGRRRVTAIAQQLTAEEELRPLVLAARAAGVARPRIHELTGLAVNTIRAWERHERYAGDAERAAAHRSADAYLTREYPNLFPAEQADGE